MERVRVGLGWDWSAHRHMDWSLRFSVGCRAKGGQLLSFSRLTALTSLLVSSHLLRLLQACPSLLLVATADRGPWTNDRAELAT